MEQWVEQFINKSNPARSEILSTNDEAINMVINGNLDGSPHYRIIEVFSQGPTI